MRRTLRLTATTVSVWLAVLAILLLPDALMITGHDGDLVHVLDLVYRWIEGDRPHLDYITPLGVLTIWPIAAFVEMGYGPGLAFRLAQATVTAAFLPLILWAALSRLGAGLAYGFASAMVLLSMALVFGGDVPSLSVSMYYNRWAWVLASILVVLLFLPPRPGWASDLVDGIVLALVALGLVLTKMTFVVALAPFALLAILIDQRWRLLVWGGLATVAVFGGATLVLGGTAFWSAYAADLWFVATGDLRPKPGEDLASILGKPAFLPASFAALLAIVFWRRTRRMREGLLLFVLAPGFVYITYQNWGNDPKWLFLLAVLLLAVPTPAAARPFLGQPAAQVSRGLALVCLALLAPSMLNIAMSPARHLQLDAARFAPIFTDLARDDVQVLHETHRLPKTQGRLAAIAFGPVPDAPPSPPLSLLGEELRHCQTVMGLVGWTRKAADQLGAVEEAVGRHVLAADLLDAMWLFGPFERLPGMGPWYYGSTKGFDAVEYIMVPHCPMSLSARRRKLEQIAEAGWVLEEVIRTDLFILLRRAG